MPYKIVFFKKVVCLIKIVKKCFLKKLKCLANIYKSGNLSDKLLKRTIYIREFISFLNQLFHNIYSKKSYLTIIIINILLS